LATPKQRRPATPGRLAIEGNIQFTPFTQALDERCQRRIRRNGLSEELNNYEAEKKSKTVLRKELSEKEAELKRLRAEIEAAKAPQSQPPDSYQPPPSCQQHVDEVEAELEALRQSFSVAEDNNAIQIDPISWDEVPRTCGPGSEGGDTIMIHEDEDADPFPSSHRQPSRIVGDSDAVTMGLELAAARQAKSNLLGSFRDQAVNTSFDFQFADTPAREQRQTNQTFGSTFRIPETPSSFYHDVSKRLKEATSRAEEAEIALTALDIEITNLGFGDTSNDDTMAMVGAIADHFRNARLELERLVPGETTAGFHNNASVLSEVLKKTKFLSSKLQARENDLKASKDQHHNLKKNFEKAIIAAEKANERIKQLDSTLDRNVEETLHVRMRSQQLEHDLSEKEKDVTALSNALNKYRADIGRLEKLINTMQQEFDSNKHSAEKIEQLEARVSSETTGRRAAELSAINRLARINDLETALATSRRHASDLESQLSSLRSSDLTSSQQHIQEVTSLNDRISSLASALAMANAEVERLKVTKAKLEERVRSEVEQAATTVETLQEQLVRSVLRGNEARKRYVNGAKVRIANWQIDDERETEMSSDGVTMVEEEETANKSRRASVKFAEYAEVETIEEHLSQEQDQDSAVDGGEESGSESIPGSVEVNRGRGRYKKIAMPQPKLVSYDKAKRTGTGFRIPQKTKKRRYDSGIGMGSDNDFEVYDESEAETRGAGTGQVRNGMMTPELSSDGDVELEVAEEAVY